MNFKLKILIAAILLSAVFTRERICNYLGFGPFNQRNNAITEEKVVEPVEENEVADPNYLVDDALYRWDEQLLDWVPVEEGLEQPQLTSYNKAENPSGQPIVVDWNTLTKINYQLRYFSEVDMELYSPVFPETILSLNGKEVIIEGFVIPFDEEIEVLSLSLNPYASCFFCGKASPASVISMYLKNKRKRYKMDDFKKFKGTLHLNYDDPNEFYYILRDAEEK